jgi:hypothetical protein
VVGKGKKVGGGGGMRGREGILCVSVCMPVCLCVFVSVCLCAYVDLRDREEHHGDCGHPRPRLSAST